MPHFGLMDATQMSEEEAALLRARLHIRGGRRRLRQGKLAAGMAALYDALSCAMRWYVLAPERRQRLHVREGEDLEHDRDVFLVLARSGILSDPSDFERLDAWLEQALAEESPSLDAAQILVHIEQLMTPLGVMPFDESSLPPEDPSTF
jgi:hypothetical protein